MTDEGDQLPVEKLEVGEAAVYLHDADSFKAEAEKRIARRPGADPARAEGRLRC